MLRYDEMRQSGLSQRTLERSSTENAKVDDRDPISDRLADKLAGGVRLEL